LTFDGDDTIRPAGWSADGKTVLFRSRRMNGEWHNRLWSVAVSGGTPSLLPIPRAEHASFDASGQRVAFVPISAEWQHWKHYRGGQADDVWLADLATKTFKRLTSDAAIDTTPVWVGDTIYFVSDRSGTSNLYKLDAKGNASRATTFTDFDIANPSTDGHRIVFEHGNGLGIFDPSSGKAAPLAMRLSSDRIHARTHRAAAKDGLRRVAISPTGKRVLIESRGQIATVPAGQGEWRVIDATPGARAQYPAWSRDGKSIAYVSDRSGEEQIWIAPASGTGNPRQLTKDHKGPLGLLVWSPDGTKLATSDREMRIWVVDATTGAMTLVAQMDRGGSYDSTLDSYRFSPDSRWLAYDFIEPNWNRTIRITDLTTNTTTRVSSPSMDSFSPAFDPAGKVMYFISTRELKPFPSPNHTLAFDKTNRISAVTLAADTPSPFLKLEDEEGIKTAPAPDAKKNDAKPVTKVDLAGIADRIVDVPASGDRYTSIVALDDALLLAVETDPVDNGGSPDAPHYELRGLSLKNPRKAELVTVSDKVTEWAVSADGKKLMIRSTKNVTIADAGASPVKDAESVALDPVVLNVDPEAEWRQIFNEAWRIGRDFFYDPNMHGVDWTAVKKKYEPQLANVGDRSELNIILGDMIAELNVGHAYVRGGDLGRPDRTPPGHLGADFAADASGKAWKIVRILPGDTFDLDNRSPLLAPAVNARPGEYIVAVAGQPVSTAQPIESMLVGLAGTLVPVSINSTPSLDGARTVLVKPIGSERALRYYDWVEGRREYVRQNGGANISYVHLPNMSARGMQEFTKQYYPTVPQSDGVILDIRNNGGGWISAVILAQIADAPRTWFKPRYGASWSRVDWATPGYHVALCDDQSYSNAEEFCDAFQRMKLGPVVGTTTWGGEVGSGGGYPLVDGGALYIPNYAAWSPADGWIIEGKGVVPDIDVQQDPAALLAGHDPQLDRAIAEIKARMAKNPVAHPTPPPYPTKVVKSE
ncbi:MAG TPA: S41 family peptidase, partial [Vicinamibacterales bacterium]